MPVDAAIAASQQLHQDETAMVGGDNPTATIEHQRGKTRHKRVTSKLTASAASKMPVKARRSEGMTSHRFIRQDGMRVAAFSQNDKVTQEASDESSPQDVSRRQGDYRGCASAFRTFRASDCTYQSNGGRRRICEMSVVRVFETASSAN
jgi:hypothetical protein